ncbi:mechanosensitive ion channel family protein, partial [Magnetococcales bacterium HHB-1]
HRLTRTVGDTQPIFLILIPLALFPMVLVFRARLRYLARLHNQENQDNPYFSFFATVIATTMIPGFLLVLSEIFPHLTLPSAIGDVLQRLLFHLALFIWAWLVSRAFFDKNGPGRACIPLSDDVALTLHQAFKTVLMGYLVFLPPWVIFRDDPFNFTAFPRLGIHLFELALILATHRLLNPKSPIIRRAFAPAASEESKPKKRQKKRAKAYRKYWGKIYRLIIIYMIIVSLLDLLGYRFSAIWLAKNGALTLVTFFLFIGIYKAILAWLKPTIMHRRRILAVVAPGERSKKSRQQIVEQMADALRFLLIITGIYLLSSYWELNDKALRVLEGYTLYSITGSHGTLELVTLADLFRFIIALFFIGWISWQLPKLYELILFQRKKWDIGLRYALVTVSRYLIIIVGILFSLHFLRLELSQIGWLVAAMSVGIGFGLQEIFANFVSGIILLLERPIRVGDMVTVGEITGKVTRINIRATTVENLDMQELLIPNKDLITQKVTNWTLSDSILRIVLPIRIAYGSNVDLAIETLLKIAQEEPKVLEHPAPEVIFISHGPSAIEFELRVFLPNPHIRMAMRSQINQKIIKAFAELNIKIPLPQQSTSMQPGWLSNELKNLSQLSSS